MTFLGSCGICDRHHTLTMPSATVTKHDMGRDSPSVLFFDGLTEASIFVDGVLSEKPLMMLLKPVGLKISYKVWCNWMPLASEKIPSS